MHFLLYNHGGDHVVVHSHVVFEGPQMHWTWFSSDLPVIVPAMHLAGLASLVVQGVNTTTPEPHFGGSVPVG